MTEGEVQIWERQPGEEAMWYQRFADFYLSQPGYRRSIRRAWLEYLVQSDPTKYEEAVKENKTTDATWQEHSQRHTWRARAEAYDADYRQKGEQVVAAGRIRMQHLIEHALDALEDALENPRSRVAAATAILDRAGLPAVSKQEILGGVSVTGPTAAELARALDELEREDKNESSN